MLVREGDTGTRGNGFVRSQTWQRERCADGLTNLAEARALQFRELDGVLHRHVRVGDALNRSAVIQVEDWVVQPEFDLQTAYYGGHDVARFVAHSLFWLHGRGDDYRETHPTISVQRSPKLNR